MRDGRDRADDEPIPVREIEHDCRDVFVRFYRHLDAREYRAALDLWHPNGTWHRERSLTRPEMLESLERDAGTAVVHHTITNMIFDVAVEQVSFSAYVTAIAADCGRTPRGTLPADSMRLYLCEGALRPTLAGWRMSRYMLGEARIELLRPTAGPRRPAGVPSGEPAADA